MKLHGLLLAAGAGTRMGGPKALVHEDGRSWLRAGVNRLSLGAQSFDDRVLSWMHRTHTAARIETAVRTAREAGLDNISLDLIFSLPESLQRNWERDLRSALSREKTALTLLETRTAEFNQTIGEAEGRRQGVPPLDGAGGKRGRGETGVEGAACPAGRRPGGWVGGPSTDVSAVRARRGTPAIAGPRPAGLRDAASPLSSWRTSCSAAAPSHRARAR